LFLTVSLNEQLLTGTFEWTFNNLIDKKLELSIFDSKYNNVLTIAIVIELRSIRNGKRN